MEVIQRMETYSVFDVASYFRTLIDEEEGDLLTNMKLQKLCYFAQGVASMVREVPLFHEEIQAWDHGPVVPELWHEYKGYGKGRIPPLADFDYSRIAPEDQELIINVYNSYGQFSGWKLSEMTHAEGPWREVYRRGLNNVITNEAIKEYFNSKDVFKSAQNQQYHIASLLEGMTPDMFEKEIGTGFAVGNEI